MSISTILYVAAVLALGVGYLFPLVQVIYRKRKNSCKEVPSCAKLNRMLALTEENNLLLKLLLAGFVEEEEEAETVDKR